MKKKILTILISASLLVASSMCTVLADNNDFCSGYWPSSQSLTIAIHPSGNPFQSYVKNNYSQWNGISNNLKFIRCDLTGPYFNSGNINIYGENLPSAYGEALNWVEVYGGYNQPSWSGKWVTSTINLDTTSGSAGLLSKSENFKKKVVIHELGHSLGLDHPDHSYYNAIMHDGDNGYYTVQAHDKDNINAKYN